MRNAERGTRNESQLRRCGFVLGALAVLLLSVAPLRAQPPDVVARAKAHRDGIKLSEWVRVTLTIEGPAPLRVELPKQLLTADANVGWRIRPDGPAKPIASLPNGRERWEQVYRLDPYVLGEPLRATFNPVTVNQQQVTWPAVEVTVDRTGGKSALALPEPRPVTTVEELPPPIQPQPQAPWPWIAVAVVVTLVCGVLLVVVWRQTRLVKPVPPGEWAHAALAKLEASGVGGEALVERVAAILREFVERRYAIPATKLTTTELSAAMTEQGWRVKQAETLGTLLEECDRAKFAGDVPDDDGCRRLLRAAVGWVDDASRSTEAGNGNPANPS